MPTPSDIEKKQRTKRTKNIRLNLHSKQDWKQTLTDKTYNILHQY